MKLHQLITVAPEVIKCRELSCTCLEAPCPDHGLREVSMAPWGSDYTPGSSKQKTEDAGKRGTTRPAANRPKSQETISPTAVRTSEQEFVDHLTVLQMCHTFEELQQECRSFQIEGNIVGSGRYIEQRQPFS